MKFRHSFRSLQIFNAVLLRFFRLLPNSLCLLFLIFLIGGGFWTQAALAQSDYSLEEALKVLELIEKVEAEKDKDYSGPLREVMVTQSELNSYLAFRIEMEEDVMKELTLKLFDENRIEGRVLLRFRGQNLPVLLNPRMVFYFEGSLKVKEGAARLVIQELFLNEQAVNPMFLDTVIYLASKFQGTENTSLNDWYELPYGIKDMKIKQGQALFYY